MYIGYAFYYFTRKSFTFAMPAMIAELGFTKSELGILATILSLMYGVSKFTSGILSDRSNPRYIMGIGLILTALFNFLFGLSSSLLFFAIFWGLNGWFQGWGWPPCARLLRHWYATSERGTWWGIWSTAHNVGGALIPLFAVLCIQWFGWRGALFIPAGLCLVVGFIIINRLRDTPQSLGLPSIEQYKEDLPPSLYNAEQEQTLPVKEILFKHVLNNKYIWILSISYFFVYVIRTAVNDWSILYLVETKGLSLLAAGGCVFWFEVGGFFGILTAGWASDKIFHGRRVPMMVIFSAGILFAIASMWFVPAGQIIMLSLSLFLVGYLIFGPQMLTGIAAAEMTHKKAAATSSGFAGLFGYVGAAAAGYPIGKVAQSWGWQGYFIILGVCAIAVLFLLTPLWSISSESGKVVDSKGSLKEAQAK
ncbi:MFS transporter [Simkania negevensis]|uniref:MFS transporter n=1 Tax=Simkania negevensis TaxID=83561 RepID=A0ABS3AQT3_9BACT|nr:MFS transporter [Simkania negevensis]